MVAFIGSLFLPESIKWLVSTEQSKRAKEELDYIAWFSNQKPLEIIRFKLEEDEDEAEEYLEIKEEDF